MGSVTSGERGSKTRILLTTSSVCTGCEATHRFAAGTNVAIVSLRVTPGREREREREREPPQKRERRRERDKESKERKRV